MRTAPNLWNWFEPGGRLDADRLLPTFRKLLLEQVALFHPVRGNLAPDLIRLREYFYANSSPQGAHDELDPAAEAIHIMLGLEKSDSCLDALLASIRAFRGEQRHAGTNALEAAAAQVWDQLRSDVGSIAASTNPTDILRSRLWWADVSVPSNSTSRSRTLSGWARVSPHWQFWVDWYEAALGGRPLLGDWDRHWELLTEIALIPDAEWNAGPERVNALIAEIVARHREIDRMIRSTPNAEFIILDEATGRLTSEPASDIDGDLREHILKSIQKALERFQRACAPSGKSNFGPVLAEAVALDLEYLREDLEDAAGYDLKLHDAINDCLCSLRRSLQERGFDADPNIVRLMNILERCAIDVLNNSTSAREVIEKRREEIYQSLRLERQLDFDQLCADMARDCLPLLQKWILADIALANDENADPDQRRRSRYNLVSRLPRGARAIRYSRFEDGQRVVDAGATPKDDKLWVATVLGPIGAALLTGLIGG